MFENYKKLNMEICLNKKDIRKSYIGYIKFDEWEGNSGIFIHDYKDKYLGKSEYSPDIIKFIKYGYKKTRK